MYLTVATHLKVWTVSSNNSVTFTADEKTSTLPNASISELLLQEQWDAEMTPLIRSRNTDNADSCDYDMLEDPCHTQQTSPENYRYRARQTSHPVFIKPRRILGESYAVKLLNEHAQILEARFRLEMKCTGYVTVENVHGMTGVRDSKVDRKVQRSRGLAQIEHSLKVTLERRKMQRFIEKAPKGPGLACMRIEENLKADLGKSGSGILACAMDLSGAYSCLLLCHTVASDERFVALPIWRRDYKAKYHRN
nr:hypothetical protein Iba_chr15bCG1130 [Ipomoea batatas]